MYITCCLVIYISHIILTTFQCLLIILELQISWSIMTLTTILNFNTFGIKGQFYVYLFKDISIVKSKIKLNNKN